MSTNEITIDFNDPVRSWCDIATMYYFGYLFLDEVGRYFFELQKVLDNSSVEDLETKLSTLFGTPDGFKRKELFIGIETLSNINDRCVFRTKGDVPDNSWCYPKHQFGLTKGKFVFDVFAMEELGFAVFDDFCISRTIQAHVVVDDNNDAISVVKNMLMVFPKMLPAEFELNLNAKDTGVVPGKVYFGEFVVRQFTDEFKDKYNLPDNTEAFVCVGYKKSLDKLEVGNSCKDIQTISCLKPER